MTCNPGMPGCPKSSQAYRLPTAHCSATPHVASKLPELDELPGQVNLEPWITLTVALTVAHERNCPVSWNSFEALAREAGVSNHVIDGITSGTAPCGLLLIESIWVHFALEAI